MDCSCWDAWGVAAQSGSGQSQQNPPPAQQQTDKDKANTLTLDTPAPPVNAEEDAAFKAFDAMPLTDGAKKIQSGEAFVQEISAEPLPLLRCIRTS